MRIERARSLTTASQRRSDFIANFLNIAGDTKRFWLPQPTDTTTSTEVTVNQIALTHNATLAGRVFRLGSGYYATFDGSANYSSFADAADLSFGDASLDTPFSACALVNITNTATSRTLFGKYTTNQREYRAYISTTDTLIVNLYDESTDATEQAASDAAVPQDAWAFLVITYDGSEDSDGVIIYVNGVPVASTKSSDVGGTYTAMENGTSVLGVGSGTNAASLPFQGGYALFSLHGTALTPAQVWNLTNLCDGHFDFLA